MLNYVMAQAGRSAQTTGDDYMANNYVQSCVVVKMASNEDAIEALRFFQQAELHVDGYEEGCETPEIEGAGQEEWEVFLSAVAEYEAICFDCRLFGKEIYLSGEEQADPEQMAYFIQFVQKHFDLNEPILITWAETCSKMREGEFSGGACLVHKDIIKFRDTPYEWFINTCREYNLPRSIS
jgi:hypothetical protein